MLKINLEDLVINTMIDIYEETGEKKVEVEDTVVLNYEQTFQKLLDSKNIFYKIKSDKSAYDEMKENSKYIEVTEEVTTAKYRLKDNISMEDLLECRKGLPDDLIEILSGKELKNSLGIVNFKEQKLNEVLDKVLDCPREFYESIAEALTPEERMFITNRLENKTCNTCTNCSCQISNTEKNHSNACLAWENKEYVGRSKVLRKKDIIELK